MSTETYNLLSIVVYGISAFIAFIMVGVALFQLRRITQQAEEFVKSNTLSQLNVLLSLEQQIAERRLELGKAGIALKELETTGEEQFDSAKLRFDEAKQMYLNVLDRLCFCVLKNLLQDEDMRLEYREVVKSAVKDFKDDFGVDTSYRNIKKVYEKWADQ